ncbi:MAG: hypothetical protein CMD99_02815 [Gammaproteobacteria bacterium]|nr:hypothetical protein [Gammaproteobacteria bacterium]
MNDKRSPYNDEPIDNDAHEVPSKSAKKREMSALQALGQELAGLSENQFEKIEFPEGNLCDALRIYRSIPAKKHEARRRQMQFVGKLMRGIQPEPLQAQLDAIRYFSEANNQTHHQAQKWRERLLADPKQAAIFLNQFRTDSQRLNQVIRAAKKAEEVGKDRGEARRLYRLLFRAITH